MIACQSCQAHQAAQAAGRPCGRYQLTCLDCCVRLVNSTRPDKSKARVMLAAIARQPGAPSRSAINDRLAEIAKVLPGVTPGG